MKDNSLLWQISGNGLKKPSYLYGTIHIQDKRVFSFDKTVINIFNSCEAYAMEAIVDEIEPEAIQKVFMMKKYSLRSLLNAQQYEKLKDILHDKFNMDISMFEKTKPMFITSQLVQYYEYRDMSEALDMYFLKIARENGKKILALEKFSEQLKAVNKITIKEQCSMLIDLIDNPDSISKKFNELLDAYLKADFKTIKKVTSDKKLPENFNTVFLKERNIKMVKRIVRYIKKHSTFNAFGAAHLVGNDSIIHLLRERLYIKPDKI